MTARWSSLRKKTLRRAHRRQRSNVFAVRSGSSFEETHFPGCSRGSDSGKRPDLFLDAPLVQGAATHPDYCSGHHSDGSRHQVTRRDEYEALPFYRSASLFGSGIFRDSIYALRPFLDDRSDFMLATQVFGHAFTPQLKRVLARLADQSSLRPIMVQTKRSKFAVNFHSTEIEPALIQGFGRRV